MVKKRIQGQEDLASPLTPEEETDEYIDVDMGEWRRGRNGQILATKGLGPCIGVAIDDRPSKSAVLCHTNQNGREFAAMMAHVARFPYKERLRVVVAGGAPVPSRAEMPPDKVMEYIHEIRQECIAALHSAGLTDAQMEIHWGKYPDQDMAIEVDTGTGEISVETNDDPRLEDEREDDYDDENI